MFNYLARKLGGFITCLGSEILKIVFKRFIMVLYIFKLGLLVLIISYI
jgi:hypothetical protein